MHGGADTPARHRRGGLRSLLWPAVVVGAGRRAGTSNTHRARTRQPTGPRSGAGPEGTRPRALSAWWALGAPRKVRRPRGHTPPRRPPAPDWRAPARRGRPRLCPTVRAGPPSRLVAVSTFVENPIQNRDRQVVLVTPTAGRRGRPANALPGLVRKGAKEPEAGNG